MIVPAKEPLNKHWAPALFRCIRHAKPVVDTLASTAGAPLSSDQEAGDEDKDSNDEVFREEDFDVPGASSADWFTIGSGDRVPDRKKISQDAACAAKPYSKDHWTSEALSSFV